MKVTPLLLSVLVLLPVASATHDGTPHPSAVIGADPVRDPPIPDDPVLFLAEQARALMRFVGGLPGRIPCDPFALPGEPESCLDIVITPVINAACVTFERLSDPAPGVPMYKPVVSTEKDCGGPIEPPVDDP